MLAEKLDKRIYVYKKQKIINELGQTEYNYDLFKSVWANIIPMSIKVTNYVSETTRAEHNFKFTLRVNSLKELTRDMYFIYKNQMVGLEH